MTAFSPGDHVEVTDVGLAALRDFCRVAFKREPEPNHHGVITEIRPDGQVVVVFDDDGSSSAYPVDQVKHLP